jgi:type II secretory pathway pseudopilin PulG
MEDACVRAGETRERGFSLLEVALSTVILGAVLIGTLGSLSTAAIGQRNDGARVESQLLLSRVMEELRATAFNSLVSYDGTWIEEGRHRADINVSPRGPGLLKLSVRVRQLENEEIETRGVLLVTSP